MSAVEAPSALPLGEADDLAAILAAGGLGYWQTDLLTGAVWASDAFKAQRGLPAEAPLTPEALCATIHPDDLARRAEAIRRSLETGAPLDIEYRAVRPDGTIRWVNERGGTQLDRNRRAARFAAVSLDITARKETEELLRAETRNLELLNKIGAAIGTDIDLKDIVQIVTDAATQLSSAQFGAFFYNTSDTAGEHYVLYAISGVPRETFSQLPMPRNSPLFETTFRGHGVLRCDDVRQDPRYGKNPPYFGMPEGHLQVASYLAVPVMSRTGRVLGGLFFGHERPGMFTERSERLITGIAAQAAIAIDNANLLKSAQDELAERRRFEKHQDMLLAEINHRVKNTLAIVLSIATQTLRHSDSPEAFRSGFEARILALAEAHNLLTDGNWEGASLRAIFDRVLGPYRGIDRPRYLLRGEGDVRVGPKTAVALVMALNELATNAAKYGALSNDAGTVVIDWTVSDGAVPRVQLRWEEVDGPPVVAPSRTGFGSRLIRNLSNDAAAEVMMNFAPGGFVCTFDLPLRSGAEA